MNAQYEKFQFIFKCPICNRREKIVVYKDEVMKLPDKLKTVLIRHLDYDPPHEIKIYVDANGNIRGVTSRLVDVGKELKIGFIVTLEIMPIIIKMDALKKLKNNEIRKILELADGFNSVNDISRELDIPKIRVMEHLAKLKKKGIIDLVYTFSIVGGGLVELSME